MKIEIETIENGVQRPYADTKYKYKIRIYSDEKVSDDFIKNLCTGCICKCKYSYGDERAWYEPYYKIEKIEQKEDCTSYLYTITSPYLD